jgi:hypothetical protein
VARKRIYTRSTSVSFTEEMYDLIKEITDRQETSISEYIRGAVLMRLEATHENHDQATTNQQKEHENEREK